MNTRSEASIKRELQRLSPKTAEFKRKIIELLENAEPEVSYAIKRDLAIMTNMPFYKDRPEVIKISRNEIDLILEYAKLFCSCEDKDFIIKLIRRLGINQGQTIRKAAPKIGEKREIWEHAIPTKFIIGEITRMILERDILDLTILLNIYKKDGQRGVTKDQDRLLKQYRHSMPKRVGLERKQCRSFSKT